MKLSFRSWTQPPNHVNPPNPSFYGLALALMLFLLAASPAWAATVTLEWDANPQPELRGYKIFCRLSSDTGYDYNKPVWAGTDGRCEITGLASGTDYCFVVRAFDAEGNESGDSNEVLYPGSQIDSDGQSASDAKPAPLPNTPEPIAMADGGLNTPIAAVLENAAQPENEASAAHAETHWQVFRDDGQDALRVYEVITALSLEKLQLPPLVLEAETAYAWHSRYINTDGNGGEWSEPQRFTTGTIAGDSDGDGLLDDQVAAPETDMNGDGIRDQTQMKIRPAKTVVGSGVIAVDALDSNDVRAIKSIRSLDPMDVELGPAEGYDLPLGLMAFKLVLAEGATGVSVALHLSHAPGEEMTLHTYSPAMGWHEATDISQLSEDGLTVHLTLTDGGIEDVDGVENGFLVFTGGYGRAISYHGTGGDTIAAGAKGDADVIGASVCFIGTAGR